MCALSVVGANLITSDMAPLTLHSGATSKSDPTAGSTASTDPAATRTPITTKDKAGAGIITVLIIAIIISGSVWLVR